MTRPKNKKNFLTHLQNSNDTIKKRWLIIFTIIGTAIAIVIWSFSLNYSINSISGSSDIEQTDSRPGFLNVLNLGLSVLIGKTSTGLANSYVYFNEKIKSDNQFIVNKADLNFIYQGLDPLPKRELP